MTTDEQIADLDVALGILGAFYADRIRERDALLGMPHRSRAEQHKLDELKLTIRQLDDGVSANDGVSQELHELVQRPEILRLRLRAPGIRVIDRRLVELRARRDADVERAAVVWPRPFRYTGRFGKAKVDGRFLDPGDVVQLTESQATGWSDRFEPIAESPVPARS